MPTEPPAPRLGPEEFRLIRDLVRAHCGIHYPDDLRYLMERRLAPRLRSCGLEDFGAYHRLLRLGPSPRAEMEAAAEALATHETYFFREPRQLAAFAEELLPRVAERNRARRRLRIWSAGCSTGEEPYTVAMLVASSGLFEGWDVSVFGSDVARRVLSVARAAAYGESAFRSDESLRLRGWFRRDGSKWVVADDIRRLVTFGHVNLLDPGTLALVARADLVFCRNVLIYFDLDSRRRALRGLHDKLMPGGYLLLGHAESLLDVTADFEMVPLRNDLVYRKPTGDP